MGHVLSRRLPLGWLVFAAALGAAWTPASAQSVDEARVRKIESEVRALQRKVFPDGAGKYFAPEVTAPEAAAANAPPATTPVTDLLARVDTIESQLARLTAQSEENGNRLTRLEARLTALEGSPAPVAAAAQPSAAASNLAAMSGGVSVAPAAAVGPSAERIAAVAAIAKPNTADKGDDEYSYGYRLWEAKFYPEAQQQLIRYLAQYPKHERVSYARNLLGRAFLDDGKPGTAAQHFLQNYQGDKTGARAADSLLFLGVAMTRLKETRRACVALQELAANYPAEVAGRLARDYAAARAAVTCGS